MPVSDLSHTGDVESDFGKWVDTVTGGAGDRAIAQRMGTDHNRVRRHLTKTDTPVAGTILEFCDAYGVSPVEGLLQAGLVRPEQVHLPIVTARSSIPEILRTASNSQLADEVTRRLLTGGEPEPRPSRAEQVVRNLIG